MGLKSMRTPSVFLLGMALSMYCLSVHSQESVNWPKGRVAVSLSYDDALGTHLDNVLPALNKHEFKASFYVVPASDVFQERLFEWRALAQQGHELGNHTLKHSCRGSLAGRDWVEADFDLDKQSVTQLVTEVRIANTLLYALDGKKQRTFTIPCGDVIAGGENYVELVANEFVSIKAMESPSGFSITHVPDNLTGEQLIDLVTGNIGGAKLINIIFHGVGGDHLSVSSEAHASFLTFLANNQDKYWVDSYLKIMTASGRPE